jgi:Holliday junction resolvase RusA-like endonuclease
MAKQRVRHSFGSCHVNDGKRVEYDGDTPYKVDYSRGFYLFDAIPMGKPRATQSDKWKTNPNHPDINKRQRPAITRYLDYKNKLLVHALQMKFEMPEYLDAVYFIPMPNSWSEKKKKEMNGLKMQVKPDTDNITKGIKDIFCKNDSHIWWERAEKRWAFKGSILIYV